MQTIDHIPVELLPRLLATPLAAAMLAATCRRFYQDVRRDIFTLDSSKSTVYSEFYTLLRDDVVSEGLFSDMLLSRRLGLRDDGAGDISGQIDRPEWLRYTNLGTTVVYVLVDPLQVNASHYGYTRNVGADLKEILTRKFKDGKWNNCATDRRIGIYVPFTARV